MGSDNLLEAKLVTANGTMLTVNACQNRDLFYAIRGGGGGTYGVITSATMKAYASPQTVFWSLNVTQIIAYNNSEWWDFIAFFQSQQARWKDGGMQGYYSLFGPQTMGTNTLTLGFYLYNKPNGTVERLIEPLKLKLGKMSDVVTYHSRVITGDSFMEVYESNSQNELVAQGGFSLGSRLLPADVFKDTKRISKILKEIGSSSEDEVSTD